MPLAVSEDALKGHYAVAVSGNWRATFRFDEGEVVDVAATSLRAGHSPAPNDHWLAAASRSRSGVIGKSLTRTPAAANTALASAADAGPMVASPAPRGSSPG